MLSCFGCIQPKPDAKHPNSLSLRERVGVRGKRCNIAHTQHPDLILFSIMSIVQPSILSSVEGCG